MKYAWKIKTWVKGTSSVTTGSIDPNGRDDLVPGSSAGTRELSCVIQVLRS